jgi:hypothetical protein
MRHLRYTNESVAKVLLLDFTKERFMMKRYSSVCFVLALAVAAIGCKKTEAPKTRKVTKKRKVTPRKVAPRKAAPRKVEKRVAPVKMVEMALPKTGLKIKLPSTAKISEGLAAGSDLIKFEGVKSTLAVKKNLFGAKTLTARLKWAKGHKIQKFKGEVLKEGKGKLFALAYKVNMFGRKGAVYIRRFKVGKKIFECYSNAKSAEDAKLFHKYCQNLTK